MSIIQWPTCLIIQNIGKALYSQVVTEALVTLNLKTTQKSSTFISLALHFSKPEERFRV